MPIDPNADVAIPALSQGCRFAADLQPTARALAPRHPRRKTS
jgi:hypothetical protein